MKIRVTLPEMMAIKRAILSGSPTKIILTMRKQPAALRTLATVAERTERTQQQQQPRQPAPPVRRVASILEQLAKKAEMR